MISPAADKIIISIDDISFAVLKADLNHEPRVITSHFMPTTISHLNAPELLHQSVLYMEEQQRFFFVHVAVSINPEYYYFCKLHEDEQGRAIVDGTVPIEAIYPLEKEEEQQIKKLLIRLSETFFGRNYKAICDSQRVRKINQWYTLYDFYSVPKE
ncbi:MAG: hypothetical protein HQM14_16790 [SAR324 cluster bacterium]|nr:hypothetical protein [SAR324 cluster bacterium]